MGQKRHLWSKKWASDSVLTEAETLENTGFEGILWSKPKLLPT